MSGKRGGRAMSEAKLDRRTERTRQALVDAFVKLLFERGYEALSVADIIEAANVGRSTFYEHYAGKEELLRQTITRQFSTLARLVGGAVTVADLVRLLEHFLEHGKLSRTLINGPTRPLMVRCLAEMIAPRLADLPRRPPGTPAPMLPEAMIATQLADGQIALIGQWLGARACRTEALAEALQVQTQAILSALLRLPAAAATLA
jgi:AcrR family transcriptional regulator